MRRSRSICMLWALMLIAGAVPLFILAPGNAEGADWDDYYPDGYDADYLAPASTYKCDLNILYNGSGSISAAEVIQPMYEGNYYDGDPGCLYWGNIINDGGWIGDWGTGEVQVGLTNIDYFPVTDENQYYEVIVRVAVKMLKGFYEGEWDGEMLLDNDGDWCTVRCGIEVNGIRQMEPYAWEYPNSAGYPWWHSWRAETGIPAAVGYWAEEFEVYDRPFTRAEVNAMTAVCQLTMNETLPAHFSTTPDQPVNLYIAWLDVMVIEADYEGPEDVPGFVLRPNQDIFNSTSVWDYPDTGVYYDKLDETEFHSDGSTTYVGMDWSIGSLFIVGFENVPSWVPFDARLHVYLWVIARETNTNDVAYLVGHVFGPLGYSPPEYSYNWNVFTSYANLSTPLDSPLDNPDTHAPWTVTQLNEITVSISMTYAPFSNPSGDVYVSQVGLVCVFTEAEDEWNPDKAPFDWDVLSWLTEGGVAALFGIMGFIGLCVVPVMAVLRHKHDGQPLFENVRYTFFLMALFFGFLLVGLAGHYA